MTDVKKAGRPPAKPGVEIQRFNAQLEKPLNRKLKMIAADQGKTPSEILNELIEKEPWPTLRPEDSAE